MTHYSDEEILTAIELYHEEKSIARTIRKLGYPEKTTLYRWINKDTNNVKNYRKKQSNVKQAWYAPVSVKLDAINRCYNQGESLQSVSEDIGYSEASIVTWNKKYNLEGIVALMHNKNSSIMRKNTVNHNETKNINEMKEQMHQMQLEIDILKETINVLKKDQGIDWSSLKNREKVVIIDALKDKYSLPKLLQILCFAKSSYYYQKKIMGLKDKYTELRSIIKQLFVENKCCYGYRRIHALLKKKGITISEKVVRRIMKEENLQVVIKKRKRYSSYKGEITPAVPNLLARNFHSEKPNEKWLTDITEFSIPAGKIYLSPIIDCFDGLITYWTIGTNPNRELVNDMLDGAISQLNDNEKPIIHSDRGCHYRWPGWIERMNNNGLTRSMSKKGCSPDNSACEGLFGRLKNEMFYNHDWANISIDEFIVILNDYLIWYNEKRVKISLGGMSPIEYRRKLGIEI